MLNARIATLQKAFEEKPIYQYVVLSGVILLALVMRFYKLGEWSLWIDEIYTINRAQIHFSDPVQVLRNLPNTLWLPLSVVLTNITISQLGVSEWNARLVSVFIGVASIPVLYFPVRKHFGISTALIFSVLLTVSTWHLFWSQNARFYTALLLFYTLAAFLFFQAIERDRPIYLLGFYILFYFALSERIIAAFLLPSIFTYLLALLIFRFELPPGFRTRNLALLTAPLILMIIFDLIRYAISDNSLIVYFINDFGSQQVDDPFRLLISIIYNISFPIFSLGLVSGAYLFLKRNRMGIFLLISALMPVILLVLANPIFFTKDRYAFVSLTFWLILAALAVKELASHTQGMGKLLGLGLLVVLLGDAAGLNVQYYLVNHGNRRDWRAAFQIVKDNMQENDAVVSWWPEFNPFYFDREILSYRDITVDEVQQSGRRHWFITDSETLWGNWDLKHWLEVNTQLINVLYLRLPEDDFNIKIYLYDPLLHTKGQ